MRLKSIHMDDFGGRSGIISSADFDIPTPTRVLTTMELNHADRIEKKHVLQSSIKFPNQTVQIIKDFDGDSLKALENNEVYSGETLSMREQFDKVQRPYNVTLLHPHFPKDFQLKDKGFKAMITQAMEVGFNAIPIPERHETASSSEFYKRIKHVADEIEKTVEGGLNKVLIQPIMSTNMEKRLFLEKLSVIEEFDCKKIIDFNYSSVKRNFPNYMRIRELSKKTQSILMLSGIQRVWMSNRRTSMMHSLQGFNIDLFAPKHREGFRKKGGEKYVIKLAKVKVFDLLDTALPTFDEYKKMHGEKIEDFPVCKGRSLTSTLNLFDGIDRLGSFSRVYEVFKSTGEFEKSADAIRKNGFRDYVDERPSLKKAVSGVMWPIEQTRL